LGHVSHGSEPRRQKFVWTYHGDSGDLAYLVTLSLEQEPENPAPGAEHVLRSIFDRAELARNLVSGTSGLRVMCFDPDQLAAFPIEEIVGWFKQSNDRVYARTAPAAEFEVGRPLSGRHAQARNPEAFHTVDEVVAVGSYPARTREDRHVRSTWCIRKPDW